ncbi:hypothetical protein B0H15DRAFT_861281 [Mycena belliarum]|uniref:Uncharacterized protein n=1 Tax=Mycena belliarum TaxID=1033014 RepID=A0AAD6XL64_9AGAR|nr:hypothetical protein B0H15DRAFT_861281 [Mycena belliae]
MTGRKTVYDFSGLNLHSDGSRPDKTSNPWRPRTRIDRRGNRVVRDTVHVPKFYKKTKNTDDYEQEASVFSGADTGESDYPTNRKGKEKERQTPLDVPGRRAKRRKIAHNVEDFLEESHPTTLAAPSAFGVPSSDLLKSIHHFACSYYSSRGQLFNDSRTYLKEKKKRRLARLEKSAKAQDADATSDEEESPSTVQKTKKAETQRRDMYKRMDGSALVAIGILQFRGHCAVLITCPRHASSGTRCTTPVSPNP